MTEHFHELTHEGRPIGPADSSGSHDAPLRWRSLEERWRRAVSGAEDGEFPPGADEPPEGLSRRRFLEIMGASVALAGAQQGCQHQPPEQIVPYVEQPEKIVPGQPVPYATATTLHGFGRGVVVQTYEGRPTKVEGNSNHPDSLGASGVFDQASILSMYDPDRSQAVLHLGQLTSWQAFTRAWERQRRALDANGGEGLAVVTGNFTSPTLMRQMSDLLERWPNARWYVHEPALRQEPERPMPVYRFDQAAVVVALDADVLHEYQGHVRYAHDFAELRRVRRGRAEMNRLYAAEPNPTVTGAKADHRLPVAGSQIAAMAAALRGRLGMSGGEGASLSEKEQQWVEAVAADLQQHRGASLVVAGPSQPPAVHAAVRSINAALGNVGQTLRYVEPFDAAGDRQSRGIEQFAQDAERMRTLLVIGCNPAYSAPTDLELAERIRRIGMRIHFGQHVNETAGLCRWHLPATHEFEMWSDVRAFNGAATVIQPLIRPLYRGRSPHELMALLLGNEGLSGLDIVRGLWRERTGLDERGFGLWWRRALHDGVVPDTEAASASPPEGDDSATGGPVAAKTEAAALELCIRPDPRVWDGRYANNAWLQELPDPISKLSWGNAALMGPSTAERLGVQNEDVVEIEHEGHRVRAPVWIVPGTADGVVTVHLGYGREGIGRVADGVGFNAYRLRMSNAPWQVRPVEVRKVEGQWELATVQQHQALEGRPLMRTATLDEFRRHPEATAGPHPEGPDYSMTPRHDYQYEGYKWGMTIDLTTCIGCQACTISCQAENNIPVVGKEGVRREREMHWIRVDRYYEGDADDPEMRFQPRPCMHCEQAPCELVCPTGATQHSTEGLNEMIYNRCIGTRYCSNNCPYKVRRFNFFDYVKEAEQPNVMRMWRNPNVTVRSRGVMEKCTYCVQRIETARIDAEKEGRRIGGDEVVPACAGACPTNAIVFGDLNQESEVARLQDQPHEFAMLANLNTRPRTTYLAEIRNYSDRMPQREREEPWPTI